MDTKITAADAQARIVARETVHGVNHSVAYFHGEKEAPTMVYARSMARVKKAKKSNGYVAKLEARMWALHQQLCGMYDGKLGQIADARRLGDLADAIAKINEVRTIIGDLDLQLPR